MVGLTAVYSKTEKVPSLSAGRGTLTSNDNLNTHTRLRAAAWGRRALRAWRFLKICY